MGGVGSGPQSAHNAEHIEAIHGELTQQLLTRGHSVVEIAKKLGISEAHAKQLVDQVHSQTPIQGIPPLLGHRMNQSRQVHLRNALGAVRVTEYDGREHLVVPVVALMDGVIHAVNASTPERVTTATLARAAHTWNGRHAVLGHPVKNGQQISANDSAVLQQQGIGTLFNSRMSGNKLLMDAYIDPVKAERVGGAKFLEDLRSGNPCEVSVGAFVVTDPTPGMHNGKPFKAIWRETAGDHLAFLPGGIGACSGDMGCGANRAAMHIVTAEGFELENLGGPGSGPQSSAHAKAADAHEKAAKLNYSANKPDMGHGPGNQSARSDKAMAASTAARDATDSLPRMSGKLSAKAADAESYAAHGSHDSAARAHTEIAAAHRASALKNAEAFKALDENLSVGDDVEIVDTGQRGSIVDMDDDKFMVRSDDDEPLGSFEADELKALGGPGSGQLGGPAPKIAVGQKVKVHAPGNAAHGQVGIVVKSVKGGTVHQVAIGGGVESPMLGTFHQSALRAASPSADKAQVGGGMDCPTCKGTGKADDGTDCPACNGTGQVPKTAARRRSLRERVKALMAKMRTAADDVNDAPADVDTSTDPEEAAELIGYQTLKMLFDQMDQSHDSASDIIDELVKDEVVDPTTTPDDEDAEEEIEAARLEAIQVLCMSMYSNMNAAMSLIRDLLTPDTSDATGPEAPRFMRAAAGRRNSAADQALIQTVHDHSVSLGADCTAMKAAATACGCGGSMSMTKEVRTAAIKALIENKDIGLTAEDAKWLEMVPDERLEAMKALGGAKLLALAKSPADVIIQNKANADAAIAAHAHGLNAGDQVMAAKKAAKAKGAPPDPTADPAPPADDDADPADDTDADTPPAVKAAAEKFKVLEAKRLADEAKLKAAQAAGLTLEEYEEAQWLKTAPASIRAMAAENKRVKAERKAELVAALKTASDALTEEQLNAKPLDELETLAKFAKLDAPVVTDFSGRGVPVPRSAGEHNVHLNPPDPYKAGIAKMRGEKAVN
jgi:hypothetical protein